MLYLALQPKGELVSAKELTKHLSIPYHFLAKILQTLSRKGLLVSSRGPTGGFMLSMPPRDITLFHIIEAIDGIDFTNKCVLGYRRCSANSPCATHDEWASVREAIYQMLISKNIETLAEAARECQSVQCVTQALA
ncbi:MAG: Rrf2 family transcriptional regulator [Ignavibacteriae bacterium]|nr:Rrf2 family transcriptional regulator [Ignavibacteriota bacterium]